MLPPLRDYVVLAMGQLKKISVPHQASPSQEIEPRSFCIVHANTQVILGSSFLSYPKSSHSVRSTIKIYSVYNSSPFLLAPHQHKPPQFLFGILPWPSIPWTSIPCPHFCNSAVCFSYNSQSNSIPSLSTTQKLPIKPRPYPVLLALVLCSPGILATVFLLKYNSGFHLRDCTHITPAA